MRTGSARVAGWWVAVAGCLAALGLWAEPAAVPAAASAPVPPEQAQSPSLAELPFWTFGMLLPNAEPSATSKGPPRAGILMWMAPESKRVRSLLIIPNNSDSKEFGQHDAVRAVAAKHEMAIVYLRSGDIPQVQAILDDMADKTGIPEFRHAPWVTFGKSSRGKFPFHMAWRYPKRTIACIGYHAETPTWPLEDWAKLDGETILQVNANGETEWGGTWFVHVRPSLLNYRAKTAWLPHQAIGKDIGHGDYPDGSGSAGWGKEFPGKMTCVRMWNYLAVFLDKALALRVPADKYPTRAPVPLKQVDESAGYVIDPFAVEELYEQPHYPLREGPKGEFLVASEGELPVSGCVAIEPAANYVPGEGVPVAPLVAGRSPSGWLVTPALPFAMKRDPLTDLGDLRDLRPKVGDKARVDDIEPVFDPLPAKYVGNNGGIVLGSGLRRGNTMTMVGYTVLDVQEAGAFKLQAPFTVAGRLRIVLNGVPVDHKQVVELKPGLYPMLMVLRMTIGWASVEPHFLPATDDEIRIGRELTAAKLAREKELEKMRGQPKVVRPLVRKATEVPEAERKRMFWVADKEQADAWLALHSGFGTSSETR